MLRKLDRRRADNYEPRVIAFRFVPGDDLRVEVLDEEHQLFEWWVNGGLGWQDVIEEQIAIAREVIAGTYTDKYTGQPALTHDMGYNAEHILITPTATTITIDLDGYEDTRSEASTESYIAFLEAVLPRARS